MMREILDYRREKHILGENAAIHFSWNQIREESF